MLITAKVIDQWVRLPVGWYEEEIKVKTEFFISVEMKYHSSEINDELSNIIDYQLFSDCINELKDKSFKLIETIAEVLISNIAYSISNVTKIESIRVTIKKPNILNSSTLASHHEIVVEKNYNH